MGKTVVKYRKDREYRDDDYAPKSKRSVQEPKYQRRMRYEEVLEQINDETDFVLDKDGLAT